MDVAPKAGYSLVQLAESLKKLALKNVPSEMNLSLGRGNFNLVCKFVKKENYDLIIDCKTR
jgi:hypothetical protein